MVIQNKDVKLQSWIQGDYQNWEMDEFLVMETEKKVTDTFNRFKLFAKSVRYLILGA